MILADKITEERKKNGWSQEELANQLGVSRQAVSKWESAGAVPDLQRILQMSELFGVSTDYLLKDEMQAENITYHESTESYAEPLKKVTMENANEFLDMKRNGSKVVANATSMCILSPILLIVLVTMAEDSVFHVSESLATVFGCVFLLGMVAAAVFLFITYGMRESHMEHFEKECFETEYGVSGMVREKKDSYEPIFIRGTAVGVVLCILAVIPTIIAGSMEASDYYCGLSVGLLLFILAIGVNLLVRVGMVKSSYDTLLQEGEYTKEEVRVIAEKIGLLVADKPDSQDICFVQDGNYAAFIEEHTGKKASEGNFVTSDGTVIGRHKGIIHYTVGQRKGLGLALGYPAFVLEIRPETNEVVIGTYEESLTTVVRAKQLNFMSVEDLKEPLRVFAKIRYNHKGAWCTVERTKEDEVTCCFEEPQRAVTPGQAIVFYDGEYVLGGGTIL